MERPMSGSESVDCAEWRQWMTSVLSIEFCVIDQEWHHRACSHE